MSILDAKVKVGRIFGIEEIDENYKKVYISKAKDPFLLMFLEIIPLDHHVMNVKQKK